MKKVLIVVVGIAILASGGYALSKVISEKKTSKNSSVIQLENGQEIRVSKKEGEGEFDREGEKADIIGQIKEISGDSIIVEQFDLSGMGTDRGEGKAKADRQMPSERPAPTVSGEVTIVLADGTSYVKGAERRMGRPGENNSESDELEEISKSDLEKGNMISIWTLNGGDTAERIMVR